MYFPLKYYGQYTRTMFPGLQIVKLSAQQHTISTTVEEHPTSPKLTTWQFKYNFKDRQEDSDLCLSAEDQASDFLVIHAIDKLNITTRQVVPVLPP